MDNTIEERAMHLALLMSTTKHSGDVLATLILRNVVVAIVGKETLEEWLAKELEAIKLLIEQNQEVRESLKLADYKAVMQQQYRYEVNHGA